jgi:NTE family protein
LDELGPVHYQRDERQRPAPTDGIGLSLSGGGYRAMLFHAGALLRLNEAGLLGRLTRVSCVSGGSLAGAALAIRWDRLEFDERGRAAALQREVVDLLHDLGGTTLDYRAVLGAILPFTSAANRMSRSYRRWFGDATLGSLPERPVFVFNATNLVSGTRWPFPGGPLRGGSGRGVADRGIEVADALAASAAFPPVLSPMRPPMRNRPVLTDGGVYDNMGLDETWKQCRTVLISDGGHQLSVAKRVPTFWPSQLRRILHVIDNQVRQLRKRQAVSGYAAGLRDGAYWGIRSNVEHFPVADPLDCPVEATLELSRVKTRLRAIDAGTQRRLVNWGFGACDAALRSHVDGSLPRPRSFPYADVGVAG